MLDVNDLSRPLNCLEQDNTIITGHRDDPIELAGCWLCSVHRVPSVEEALAERGRFEAYEMAKRLIL
jgi:hypothetical protein